MNCGLIQKAILYALIGTLTLALVMPLPTYAEPYKMAGSDYVTKRVQTMTLEQKVAQLFILTPDQLGITSKGNEKTRELFRTYPIGGLIFFEPHLKGPLETSQMLNTYQDLALASINIPLFLSIDEEGGRVTRIANNPNFNVPRFPSLNRLQTQDEAYELGTTLGTYLKPLGFNLNFAPVADLWTNPQNTIVRYRAFRKSPLEAATMVGSQVKGMLDQKIIATLKHFPGHGATQEDSHLELAKSYQDLEDLKATNWPTFEAGIQAGAQMVMMGHIALPQVLDQKTPASLSESMIETYLRGTLNFDGVVITDALNMGAITRHYKDRAVGVIALKAGVDILLMPRDFQATYEGILEAVATGDLSEARIDQAVTRILSLKESAFMTNRKLKASRYSNRQILLTNE